VNATGTGEKIGEKIVVKNGLSTMNLGAVKEAAIAIVTGTADQAADTDTAEDSQRRQPEGPIRGLPTHRRGRFTFPSTEISW
jgi:hypothetical protein